jgi:hypothetical protein
VPAFRVVFDEDALGSSVSVKDSRRLPSGVPPVCFGNERRLMTALLS